MNRSFLLLVIIILCACSPSEINLMDEQQMEQAISGTLTSMPQIPTEDVRTTNVPKSSNPTKSEPTPLPTETPVPTETPLPTDTPTPEYKEPAVLLELDGVGETVSENYSLPQCFKVVLYWSVEANSSGTGSLIVHLHNVQEGTEHHLVNEFGMDQSNLNGSMLTPLIGGEYFFTTENTDESWSLRIECQDRDAPAAVGIDLQGSGNLVTDNFELHQCQKSVFVWSTDPNNSGSASLIVHLCKDGDDDCIHLVNEFDMDLTDALAGETLQGISGGNYFLEIDNTSGRTWSVRWECRD